MTVLVTGAKGFIGKNLVAALYASNISVLEFDKGNTDEELGQYIRKADFIFHLAGVNRPKEISEFDKGNRGFTEDLLRHIKESGKKIPVLMTSSIQAQLDNPYGISKREAEQAMLEFAKEFRNPVYIYRLPNVFGKWCRPNYNSVVASFCHNIANDLPITINGRDTLLSLVYIDDVVSEFINAMNGKANKAGDTEFYSVRRVFKKSLGEIADLLDLFKSSRKTLVIPDMSDIFTRFLYAAYVSYLPENSFGYSPEIKTDNRGWLSEIIKGEHFGQIFVSKTKPGITRGNHWHHTKVEKFIVVDGNAVIRLRKIDGGDIIEIAVSGDDLKIVDIPTGYTHSITNVGQTDLITLFWADEIFNPELPDTFYNEV